MSWDRICGHDGPKAKLIAAVRAGRLAHANLFVGPDGIGKRQCAFELAKTLLCEAAPTPGEPCDRCPACVQVMAGTHPDCFSAVRKPEANELDVETMRAFAHRLGLKASRGSRKVGIVEDADDFNASSANSFLKPLEEPPPGSVLVLLATSTERQLPTILSRCHVLPFSPLSTADLRAVLADHGVTDPARQDRLVRLGHGSPGRALAFQDDAVWSFRNDLLTGSDGRPAGPGSAGGVVDRVRRDRRQAGAGPAPTGVPRPRCPRRLAANDVAVLVRPECRGLTRDGLGRSPTANTGRGDRPGRYRRPTGSLPGSGPPARPVLASRTGRRSVDGKTVPRAGRCVGPVTESVREQVAHFHRGGAYFP